jgi:hypothetical protein
MKLANHPPLLRPSPTKEKSFRPLLEVGGEERRREERKEGHTPLN